MFTHRTSRNALLCSLVSLLALLSLTFQASVSRAQSNSRYFPETGRTVQGRFLDYWTEHGGLKVHGLPISEEIQERSDSDGKSYTVQYFEMSLFELHPENVPPYDVLLALLGKSRLKYTYPGYPSGTAREKPNTSADSRFFPQTGKWVGGSFLKFWEAYGGLARFGYPITNELLEPSTIKVSLSTVQYFERAVLEWQPGSTPPDDVMPAPLGRVRYESTYSEASGIPAYATLLSEHLSGLPVVAGNFLAWIEQNTVEQSSTLVAVDLATGTPFTVVANFGGFALTSDDNILAWVEGIQGGRQRIVGYDLARKMPLTFFQTVEPSYVSDLALDSKRLFYVDKGLYEVDLATGKTGRISEYGFKPVANEGYLIWSEPLRADECRRFCGRDTNLRFGKIGSGEDKVIGGVYRYDRYGYTIADGLVLGTSGGLDHGISIYDIKADTTKYLAEPYRLHGTQEYFLNPMLSSNSIIWNVSAYSGRSMGQHSHSVESYSLDTGRYSTLIRSNANDIYAAAVTHDNKLAVIEYSQRTAAYRTKLHLVPIQP